MFVYLNKRGQSTLEYGVIVAVIVAALLAMQFYLKRGVQGKLKQAADDTGEQYTPLNTTSNTTTTTTVNSTETVVGGSNPTTTTVSDQNQTRTSSENVGSLDQETWNK